jgi:K+-sensing histidine kinase KdpD
MKSSRFGIWSKHLVSSFQAVLTVLITTIPLFLIGRAVLGEAVIALIYLIPVSWSGYKWGQMAGISAALTATLCFNFLFIPPFYTFAIGSLEGWLVLAIFLSVAIVVIERIQASLSQARDAVFMYEMSTVLGGQRKCEGVAYALASKIQMLFMAAQVTVIFHPDRNSPAIIGCMPEDGILRDRPDRILPIVNSWGYVGEIQIWRGVYLELPQVESRLFQDFIRQAGRAFERTLSMEHDLHANGTFSELPSKGLKA